MKAFKEICRYSSKFAHMHKPKKKWVECMGYIFCKISGNDYIVDDVVGISQGGEMYVTMSPDDLARVEKEQANRPGTFTGGWWHTHPGLTVFFSHVDCQNQLFWQAQNEDGLGIVFDLEMIDETRTGLAVFRVDDPMSTDLKYHEVKWEALDWTSKDFLEAIQMLGISTIVGKKLAQHLKLLPKEPPKPEPEIIISPDMDFLTEAKKNQARADLFIKMNMVDKVLEAKKTAIILLSKSGERQLYIDQMIDYVEYSLKNNRIDEAKEVLIRLDVMKDEHRFPEEDAAYYTGRTYQLLAEINYKEGRFSKYVDYLEEAIKCFNDDEYEIGEAECLMKLGEIYEIIYKEPKMAIEIYGKTKKKINKILEDFAEELEDEPDNAELIKNVQKWKEYLKIVDNKIVQQMNEKKSEQGSGMKRIL